MMINKPVLQPGITHLPIDETGKVFASEINWEQFKSTCYLAARNYGGKFIRITAEEYPDNYRVAWFTHKYDPSKRILAMINVYYPLMGFLEINCKEYEPLDSDRIPTRFHFSGGSFHVDKWFSDEALVSWFSVSYRVLHISELLEPLRFELKRQAASSTKRCNVICLLNDNELSQADVEHLYANKWQVKSIAEAIYGTFD